MVAKEEEPAGGAGWPTSGDTVHIAYTSNGSPYTNFQVGASPRAEQSFVALFRSVQTSVSGGGLGCERRLCRALRRRSLMGGRRRHPPFPSVHPLLQNLIMYGTYQLAKKQPGGEKMVAFTRILHRTNDDALSTKLDTFRANPLHPGARVPRRVGVNWPAARLGAADGSMGRHGSMADPPRRTVAVLSRVPRQRAALLCARALQRPPLLPPPAECDGWCDYPVADRPNAVRQYLQAAKADPSLIKASRPARARPSRRPGPACSAPNG